MRYVVTDVVGRGRNGVRLEPTDGFPTRGIGGWGDDFVVIEAANEREALDTSLAFIKAAIDYPTAMGMEAMRDVMEAGTLRAADPLRRTTGFPAVTRKVGFLPANRPKGKLRAVPWLWKVFDRAPRPLLSLPRADVLSYSADNVVGTGLRVEMVVHVHGQRLSLVDDEAPQPVESPPSLFDAFDAFSRVSGFLPAMPDDLGYEGDLGLGAIRLVSEPEQRRDANAALVRDWRILRVGRASRYETVRGEVYFSVAEEVVDGDEESFLDTVTTNGLALKARADGIAKAWPDPFTMSLDLADPATRLVYFPPEEQARNRPFFEMTPEMLLNLPSAWSARDRLPVSRQLWI